MIFKSIDELINSGKKYDLLYADPPWKYERDTDKLSGCVENRAGGEGYITMNDDDISKIDLKAISEKNSIMCMWATGPRMDSAIRVMNAWGFKYLTVMFVWCKTTNDLFADRPIMGNYTRPSTEFILLGKRGNGIKIPKEQKVHLTYQVQRHPIVGHSIKPQMFSYLIEKQFHTAQSKIEMFARVGYAGWDLFGNQAEYGQRSPRVTTLKEYK